MPFRAGIIVSVDGNVDYKEPRDFWMQLKSRIQQVMEKKHNAIDSGLMMQGDRSCRAVELSAK